MTSPVTGPIDMAALNRRRRAKNWALLGVLVGLCALIFAVTIVRVGGAN